MAKAPSKAKQAQLKVGVDIGLTVHYDMDMLKNIIKVCKEANRRHIRYGWIDKTKYSEGKNKGLYVATVAYWQEYGTYGGKHIPERPYFRQTKNVIRSEAREDIKKYFRTLCRGLSGDARLETMAKGFKITYMNVVGSQIHKKLAASTIRIKGKTYQLDHTGKLLSDFNAKVFKKGIDTIK